MSEYLHGAYGDSRADGNRVSVDAEEAFVCFGTAPVQTLARASGESYNVNKPVVVHNIAEAKAAFGYSDDWAKYTLCEAFHHFFETMGIGPLVVVNVLDPTVHKAGSQTTVSLTPVNNTVVIADAEDIVLDSITVTVNETVKTKGTDYTVSYNSSKKQITITGITNLGTSPISISYDTVTPANVTDTTIIGSSDGLGTNTGIFAVKNVYPMTGLIPSYLMAPGWSSVPTVHAALIGNSRKINGHWDAWVFSDLPLLDGATPITMNTAASFKSANGYNNENETVYFPMAEGTDGKKYHLSTIAAAISPTVQPSVGSQPPVLILVVTRPSASLSFMGRSVPSDTASVVTTLPPLCNCGRVRYTASLCMLCDTNMFWSVVPGRRL